MFADHVRGGDRLCELNVTEHADAGRARLGHGPQRRRGRGAEVETNAAALGEANLQKVHNEMADVPAYLVWLGEKLDVDLHAAVLERMVLNRAKSPADKVRGDARKYTDYPKAND